MQVDLIGPPDPVSNLRPIIFAKSENESRLEKKFREAREDTQIWNQNFWTEHNNNFQKVRHGSYITSLWKYVSNFNLLNAHNCIGTQTISGNPESTGEDVDHRG